MFNLWKRFEDKLILISRTKRGLLFEDADYNIDVDFVWSFMVGYVGDNDSLVVVSSTKNIWASLLLLFQNRGDVPIFIFPPYLRASRGAPIETLRILGEYDSRMIKILLGSVMDWSRKESRVDESIISAVRKLDLKTILRPENKYESDLKTFLEKRFNSNFVREAIVKRKKVALGFLI